MSRRWLAAGAEADLVGDVRRPRSALATKTLSGRPGLAWKQVAAAGRDQNPVRPHGTGVGGVKPAATAMDL